MRTKLAVAGVVAAVAALGATAPSAVQAAGQITGHDIKNGSISGKDVKDASLTGKQVKDGSLSGADLADGSVAQSKLGALSVTGNQVQDGSLTGADLAPGTLPRATNVKWAVVGANHAILAQSGGISVTSSYTGGTYLDMGTDMTGWAISATPWYTNTDYGFRGTSMATICGNPPAGATCSYGNNTDNVWVYTMNPANTAGQDHAFMVTAIR